MTPSARPAGAGRALYRALLVIAPRRLRREHGEAMEELFAERLAAARARGRRAALAAWLSATADLLVARLRPAPRATLTVPVPEGRWFMSGSDVRYAWRALLRQRGASALVVLMLGLGIAANVAVFTLVDGLFLRPFPFPQPDRLVYINTAAPKWNLQVVGIDYRDFDRWQKDQRVFEAMAARYDSQFTISDASGAERIDGAAVTTGFFRVLGLRPVLGRTFTADEDRPNGPKVAVIRESLWRSRYGADPAVLGKSIRLDGEPYAIVGVAPDAAAFPQPNVVWVPMQGDAAASAFSYNGDAFGRLKPGVTAEQAQADIIRVHQAIWETRDKQRIVTPYVRPLRENVVSNFAGIARTVMISVALLLLIACANVAAVMLARALARRKEMGVRLALGSTRLRLLRQLLVENLLLAVAGAGAGVLAGSWALHLLLRLVPNQFPAWVDFSIDARIALFVVAVTGCTIVLFGWAPALHAVDGDLRSAVAATTNGTTAAPRGRRTLHLLVGAEFALAALLLVAGALFLEALDRVRHVDPGFRSDHVLVAAIPLSEGTRPKPEQWHAFWGALGTRLSRLPGVDAVGFISCPPLSCHNGTFFEAENAPPRRNGDNPVVLTRRATPGYFAAMGIRLESGRFLQEADNRAGAAPTVVVNETFVRTFWGDGVNAVGRRIRDSKRSPWITIVGVAGDVRHYGLDQPVRPGVYLPEADGPRAVMSVALHTTRPPESLAAPLRDVLRQMDPDVPLSRVRTMEQALERSLALRGAFAWMLGVFAGLAFVLAVGGAYGVATYLVAQRTREIGIRVALGARSNDIFRGIIVDGIAAVAAGLAVGLTASVLAGRLVGGAVLFGVSARDPAVLAMAAAVLLGTALVANALPARRAIRADPMRALRTE